MALNAWRDALPERCRQILQAQLDEASLIQRQGGDAKVCFYCPKNASLPCFKNADDAIKVAVVVPLGGRMLKQLVALEPSTCAHGWLSTLAKQ